MIGQSRLSLSSAAKIVGGLAGVALLLVLPLLLTEEYRNLANLVLFACLGALSLHLVLGEAGQVSLANAAFLAVGGYAAATCAILWGWPVIPSLIFAAVAGAVVGALVGLPSLRLRGLYLIVATLALHYVVFWAAQKYQKAQAGPIGFLVPPLQIGDEFLGYAGWYYILLPIVALVVIVLVNLRRSAIGRAWRMIKDAEVAGTILGINASRYKVLAFALSAVIASLQGGLLAYYQSVVSFETISLAVTIGYFAMVIIGGLGSITGAIIGATIFTILPSVLEKAFSGVSGPQVGDIQGLVFGALIPLILIFAPEGLAGVGGRAFQRISASVRTRGPERKPTAAVLRTEEVPHVR
jgi:branched-chain amino acid transport system permease protein